MANALFNIIGNIPSNNPTPLGNFANMMQQFMQFKANFQGDPKAEVERLLQSGRMSQAQLNQLQNVARQFAQFIPK